MVEQDHALPILMLHWLQAKRAAHVEHRLRVCAEALQLVQAHGSNGAWLEVGRYVDAATTDEDRAFWSDVRREITNAMKR